MGNPVEMPCEFVAMPRAESLELARKLSRDEVAARLSSYMISASSWESIVAETGAKDPALLIFAEALGGDVVESHIRYEFDGRGLFDAHVDEVPENLLDLRHYGKFNVHKVLSGAVTACTVYTRPGYYVQDTESRVPRAGFNFGITQDLLRRRLINTYSTDTVINEARLQAGDRVVFFERTHPIVDGPPNVVHLFHRGTEDRSSEVLQYFAIADK
jgi:hypothetical protein